MRLHARVVEDSIIIHGHRVRKAELLIGQQESGLLLMLTGWNCQRDSALTLLTETGWRHRHSRLATKHALAKSLFFLLESCCLLNRFGLRQHLRILRTGCELGLDSGGIKRRWKVFHVSVLLVDVGRSGRHY